MGALLKKIGELLLGEFKSILIDRLSRVETKIDGIDSDIGEIKKDLKALQSRSLRFEAATHEIQSILQRAGAQLNQPLLISPGSPLKLTELGEDLAQKIDGYNFIEKNKDFFFVLIDKNNPSSDYDVQELSKKVLTDSINHPVLNPIKEYAYENGMSLDIFIGVLGIILRDKYISEHKK